MPNVGMIGRNGSTITGIVSNEFPFNEGPAPGFVNATFVMQFTGFSFVGNPNVIVSTGNPHWTAHPIWVAPTAAGFVVNRKTPSYGGRQFNVYPLAMGLLGVTAKDEIAELSADIIQVTEEDFLAVAKKHNVEVPEGLLSQFSSE
ncbi:MAG: hypothetical protein PVJ60_08800 [Phycisphaerales bacterium]|jgi:hypothetical protein